MCLVSVSAGHVDGCWRGMSCVLWSQGSIMKLGLMVVSKMGNTV